MLKLLYIILITKTLSQDITLQVSDRSIKLFDLLLPEISKFLTNFCLKDLPPITKKIMGANLIITPKLICIDSVQINIKSIKSLKIIDKNTITISIPEFTVEAHMEELVSLNGSLYDGKSKLGATKMGIVYTVRFFEDEIGHFRLDLVDLKLSYDKLNIDFDNKWIENAYYYLLNYNFIKDLIINNIVFPQVRKQTEVLFLEQFLEVPLDEKVFVLGLFKLPFFFEDDEKYLLVDFVFEEKKEFLKKQHEKKKIAFKEENKIVVDKKYNLKTKNTLISEKLDNLKGKIPNFSLEVQTSLLQKLSLAFKDKFTINLNSIKLVNPFLTVKNLSIIFPGLSKNFKNENEKIDLSLEVNTSNENFLIQRKYNLFLFTNLKLTLKNILSKNNICDFNIENYLNFRLSSSMKNKNIFYLNQPEMRIKDFYSDFCTFKYNKKNYINLFENLLDMKLLSFSKLDYSVISDVLDGPFVYLKEDSFLVGFDLKIDI